MLKETEEELQKPLKTHIVIISISLLQCKILSMNDPSHSPEVSKSITCFPM